MKETFIIITWPEIQDYMDVWFEENSCLINEEPFLSEYGLSLFCQRIMGLKKQTNKFNNIKITSYMKTILVVYTDQKLSVEQINSRKMRSIASAQRMKSKWVMS